MHNCTLNLIYSTERRYSNLCALCEDPVKCDYPDKYSGYEGAIRCLVENGGDVAFTKVIYVRRFFGVSGIFLSKYINTLTKLFLFEYYSEAAIKSYIRRKFYFQKKKAKNRRYFQNKPFQQQF